MGSRPQDNPWSFKPCSILCPDPSLSSKCSERLQFVALLLWQEQPMHMLLTETRQHPPPAMEHLLQAMELLNPLMRNLTSPQLSLGSLSLLDCPCCSQPMSPLLLCAESERQGVPKMRAQCPT